MGIVRIKKTAVIGAGIMGSQIAETFSRVGGYEVAIVDIDKKLVEKGLQAIEERLERFFVSKGKMTNEQKEAILGRISGGVSMAELVREADFVVEAIPEDLALKKRVFSELDNCAPKHAILASNTSSLNITEISSSTSRPEKVIGMHFFNPVAVMKLVEVVKGVHTSKETIESTCTVARKLGKEPVICKDTSFGFLANRAYNAMVNEAVQMLWERVASPEDIDKALKLGYNLPIGPLELMDRAGGWSIAASSEQDRIREIGFEKGRLHPLVKTMLRAGYTGGPGKKGIYEFWREVLSRQ